MPTTYSVSASCQSPTPNVAPVFGQRVIFASANWLGGWVCVTLRELAELPAPLSSASSPSLFILLLSSFAGLAFFFQWALSVSDRQLTVFLRGHPEHSIFARIAVQTCLLLLCIVAAATYAVLGEYDFLR